MSVPVLGILIIYLGYRCHRRTYQSISAVTIDTEKDEEKGGDSLVRDAEEVALASRKSRDVVIYLAIGWLFLVYTCVCPTYDRFSCAPVTNFAFFVGSCAGPLFDHLHASPSMTVSLAMDEIVIFLRASRFR